MLIQGKDVKVDESSLTGEPDPIAKDPHDVPFMFAGTVVTESAGTTQVCGYGKAALSLWLSNLNQIWYLNFQGVKF